VSTVSNGFDTIFSRTYAVECGSGQQLMTHHHRRSGKKYRQSTCSSRHSSDGDKSLTCNANVKAKVKAKAKIFALKVKVKY